MDLKDISLFLKAINIRYAVSSLVLEMNWLKVSLFTTHTKLTTEQVQPSAEETAVNGLWAVLRIHFYTKYVYQRQELRFLKDITKI